MIHITKRLKEYCYLAKHISAKKLVVICVIIVVLIGVGVVVIQSLNHGSNNTPSDSKMNNDKIVKLVDDAETLVNSGDISGAKAAYDSIIELVDDPYLKSVLLINKATVLFNDSSFDESLDTAKQAEAYNMNLGVARFIAQVYEKTGDYKSAIEYYQKAIELTDMSDPWASGDIKYYQAAITSLNGASD